MKSIAQNDYQDKVISDSISRFFKQYHVIALLKAANAYKSKGISLQIVFFALFSAIFTHRSLYMGMLTKRDSYALAKDTVYRFLNAKQINWLKFTSLLSARIAAKSIIPLTQDNRVNVLIIDDSMFSRSRSKNVELLARVYDHAKGVYDRGFRLLTVCWSDGNTVLPVNSCLLSSANAKNRLNEANDMDHRTLAYKRRQLSQTKAPQVMLELLRSAKAAGVQATHVLFDTWFCSPSSLLDIKSMGYDVVAMAKKTSKVKYLYNGIKMSVPEIFRQSKKRRGRSKYLLSTEIRIEKEAYSIPARLIYVRNRNKKGQYLVLITTDMGLSEEEVIRLYGKRWGIEVFFKFCKSYLKLSKECRSLSYDAMTAHVAIIFTRYMMLAVENRLAVDERSMGELFYLCTDEMADITWYEAFQQLMRLLEELLTKNLDLSEKELQKILDVFLDALPRAFSAILQKTA
jgi:Transposase DDE domain.